MPPCTTVEEKLRSAIRKHGPIPFSSFMGTALYDPDGGYYASGEGRIGRTGDYFTSVSTGPVFGELLAGQFAETWEWLERPVPFTVIEQGAHDGRFAADVLTWAAREAPDFFAALTYAIDEPVAALRTAQRRTLAAYADKVTWDTGGPVTGVFFANELLDAIPFRRVQWVEGAWRELCVGLNDGGAFTWVRQTLMDGATRRRLGELGEGFPDGYTTEVAPAAASALRYAAGCMRRGVLVFIDYGYTMDEYYAAHRSAGTLRCYRGHRAHEDPFDAPGATDITAHVDFSFVTKAAIGAGCEVAGFLDQAHFLTGAAEATLHRLHGRSDPASQKWTRAFQTLTHPSGFGRSFHALVLTRGTTGAPPLSGLRYSRSSVVAGLAAGANSTGMRTQ